MFCVTGASGSGTKPAGKGVDMDAVGNINGVPVYEFDLDGLKVEDKPWRKPGTSIFCCHALSYGLLYVHNFTYVTVYWLFCLWSFSSFMVCGSI